MAVADFLSLLPEQGVGNRWLLALLSGLRQAVGICGVKGEWLGHKLQARSGGGGGLF